MTNYRALTSVVLATSTLGAGASLSACAPAVSTDCGSVVSSLTHSSAGRVSFRFSTSCGHENEYAAVEYLNGSSWKTVENVGLSADSTSVTVVANFCTAGIASTFRGAATLGELKYTTTNQVTISWAEWRNECPV